MTDAGSLQVSLAILGGLVLAGVVAHGAWTARKHQPRQPTAEPLEGQGTDAFQTNLDPAQAGDRLEPSFGSGADLASGRFSPHGNADKTPRLNALIDAIASIALAQPVSGEAALLAMPATRRTGSKQFNFEALNSDSGHWEFPTAHASYTRVQCGVQLANRHGALHAIEFSEFVVKVQAVADTLGGDAEFPDMQDAVVRAKELDLFATEHDAQLSFTLRAVKAAWSPGYVQQCAARLGFVASVIPGQLVLLSTPLAQENADPVLPLPAAVPLLTLHHAPQADPSEEAVQPGLREVQLVLDVPQVPQPLAPFPRLCEVALALAAAMDGEIVDDKGQRIQAQAMESIYSDLDHLYQALEARGVPAGSTLARRLFS